MTPSPINVLLGLIICTPPHLQTNGLHALDFMGRCWRCKNISFLILRIFIAQYIFLLSFANFGYVSLTFYDRFFKLAVLFLYVFTYMWVMDIQSKLSFKSQLLITMVTIIPVLYFIVTPLVEQRHMLFQLNLWFSNLCS